MMPIVCGRRLAQFSCSNSSSLFIVSAQAKYFLFYQKIRQILNPSRQLYIMLSIQPQHRAFVRHIPIPYTPLTIAPPLYRERVGTI